MQGESVWHCWQHRLDAWRFASHRADYFEYLHAVLEGSAGRLTIRELFDRDAARYGPTSARGRLSSQWARACEASGGELHVTWRSCFPGDELLLVRVAQAFGNTALMACFESLAHHLGLLIQARRVMQTSLGAAGAAALVASLMLLALPAWTVPALQRAFQGLPEAYLGVYSVRLFATAQWLSQWGALVPVLVASGAVALWRTLPRSHGPLRRWLDRWGPWRLYRQVQALRLLALVNIVLQPAEGVSTQLRPAMMLFLQEARPWLGAHLRDVIRRIDQGRAGAEAFDTGLLDREMQWFLEDMVAAHGLAQGLRVVHARMSRLWLARIGRQAWMLRWLVLLSGVMFILALGIWHYAAIEELRRGWMMFHAGR